MADVNLVGLANGISRRKFKVGFDGKVILTDKLLPLRQYGRFVPESNTIYLAVQFFTGVKSSNTGYENGDNKEVDRLFDFGLRVLEHELVHWYCYHNGLEYHDGTTDFEDMLEKHECITNGNFPNAVKKYAFGRTIEPMYCKGCDKPQFDRLSDSNDLLAESHCCKRLNYSKGSEFHKYYYYDYKVSN